MSKLNLHSYYNLQDRATRSVLYSYHLNTITLVLEDLFTATPLLSETNKLAVISGVYNGRLVALDTKNAKRYSFFKHSSEWSQATSYHLPENSKLDDINIFIKIYKDLDLKSLSSDELKKEQITFPNPDSLSEYIKDSVSYYTLTKEEKILIDNVLAQVEPFIQVSKSYTSELTKTFTDQYVKYSEDLKKHTENLVNFVKDLEV